MGFDASTERYDGMVYRRCGRSGVKLPAISLGLWHNFGADSDGANAREMVHQAFDLGITHFDMANNYGPPPGAAESTFGRILNGGLRAYRDEIIVSTKAGFLMWPGPYGEWGSRKNLLASLDQSLQRMGLDYVDIFYSHRPDPDTPLEETMGALDSAVRQGKALYAGISSYGAQATREAAAILATMGTPCLIHQPSYNLLNRSLEGELLPVLEDVGVGCIAFCPLAQGLLTSKYLNGIPEGSRAARPGPFLTPERVTTALLDKVRRLKEIAQARGQSLAQMALCWVLRDERVTSALSGASCPEQIRENVEALKGLGFSGEELGLIDAALAE